MAVGVDDSQAPPDLPELAATYEVLDAAADFLSRYYHGTAATHCLPLCLGREGAFGQRVLERTARVRWGEVITYGELARAVGKPGAARAVGQIMARNMLPPFVPCHRVVGAGYHLTGFVGGLELKARMLELEGWEVSRIRRGKWRLAGRRLLRERQP